ncbi:MAG: hypothetical protein ACRCXZ_06340 [Patescibacteria group bacterium]
MRLIRFVDVNSQSHFLWIPDAAVALVQGGNLIVHVENFEITPKLALQAQVLSYQSTVGSIQVFQAQQSQPGYVVITGNNGQSSQPQVLQQMMSMDQYNQGQYPPNNGFHAPVQPQQVVQHQHAQIQHHQAHVAQSQQQVVPQYVNKVPLNHHGQVVTNQSQGVGGYPTQQQSNPNPNPGQHVVYQHNPQQQQVQHSGYGAPQHPQTQNPQPPTGQHQNQGQAGRRRQR